MFKKALSLTLVVVAVLGLTNCEKKPITTMDDGSSPIPPWTTKIKLTISRMPVLNDTATLTIKTCLYDVGSLLDSAFNFYCIAPRFT
ncbi:hypothetical protein HY768_10310 [candidate division TA06 bacterium]|uniref:Uncharacterized protein n=1 Tax=candidate division TA06 bacterium TaxID=2250710 RepID=A0A933IC56_UNCT6|nr:hypothetical protein [candidate division TA06 bacterium]